MKMFDRLEAILPEADVHPLVKAFLSQGDNHQVLFMEMTDDVIVPEHSHGPQLEFVVDGQVELTTPAGKQIYRKGDWFFIEEGMPHAGDCKAGYKAIAVFFQPDRYKKK